MSTRKGQGERKRPQKYQNTHAYKNDLHDKTVQIKLINSLQICGVCERCKSILEWKIKYKKYKPIKAAKTCTKCDQKTVKHAYHIMCKPCAQKFDVCPKCGNKEELVIGKPTPEEELKLDQEMQAVLKSLPERKRRTFLRYMEKNAPGAKAAKKKEAKKKAEHGESTENVSEEEDDAKGEEKHLTKDDILAKLQALKLSVKNGEDDDLDDFGDSDDDFEDTSDESSDEDCAQS